MLELIDLADWANEQVSHLSGGMRRRVEVARALLHDPQVLFLDDPTSGLNPQTRSHIWDYLLRLQKERDLTIFLTTYYIEESEIWDKVAIIDQAQIVVNASPQFLKEKYTRTRAVLKGTDLRQIEILLLQENLNYDRKDPYFFIFKL